ncbi:MAG: M28 family peptidase [Candidatus Promineifilaceae bacterium]
MSVSAYDAARKANAYSADLLLGIFGINSCVKKAVFLVLIIAIAMSACSEAPVQETASPPTASPPTQTPIPPGLPLSLVSQESLFAYLEELTAIQSYSGWRNSATEGEAEALDYAANTLDGFAYLQDLGTELERQSFHVFMATEIWETRLSVTIGEQETEIPADAPRGHRNDVEQALRFDSDGVLNDSERNPVEVTGEIALVRSADDVDVAGKIVFLDYATIDPKVSGSEAGTQVITDLIEDGMSGLVLVTQASNGHVGKYVGDGIPIEEVAAEAVVPILYVRLEDLASAGISDWEDLAQIEEAHLVWDTDVFSPGTSGNLVARIPGANSSRAVILGAHIDSPNNPGAMDNGVASAALLEVARILDEAQIQPAVDLYLVWFGSEEIWFYGSSHFVNTHQELLDRTIAAFVMEGMTSSVPDDTLTLLGWSHSRFGDNRLAYADYINQKASSRNITINEPEDFQGITTDNGPFCGFVPQTVFAFGSEQGDYAHSPYDTVETAHGLGDAMEQVASVALIAALETGRDAPQLYVTPEPSRRAVIVASHTEVAQMTPATLIDLDRALAWEGFDVDVIPYGQAVTPDDLIDAGLVIVLPVIDYPSLGGDLTLYDEAWSDEEITALVDYVEQGGLLVVTNSAKRVQMFRLTFEANEDWEDANALAEHFGVSYEEGVINAPSVRLQEEHPLIEGQSRLFLIGYNGVPFSMQNGMTLAEFDETPVMGLVDYGESGGQVLVLSDVGILGIVEALSKESDNFTFLRNLARYAVNMASQ